MFFMNLETWIVRCENEQGEQVDYAMLLERHLTMEEKQSVLEKKARETEHPKFIKAMYGYTSIHNIGESMAGEGFYCLD